MDTGDKEKPTKNLELRAPRGMEDILPHQWRLWRWLEDTAREIFELSGYHEVRTPIFEDTRLFVRGIGDTSDIVEKEMYTFADSEGSSITLRPENTAGVMRAYVEHELYKTQKFQKLYYIGPQFRKERPQAGRLRQFHQMGIEAVGTMDPLVDVETVSVAAQFYDRLCLTDYEIKLNTIGCEECRPPYRKTLKEELAGRKKGLCKLCLARMERNVFRVLDCKEEGCKEIASKMPVIYDYLCKGCKDHFDVVKGALSDINIKYDLDPFLVRGLDYYTKTVYEIVLPSLGARSAICAGGRYDNLISEIGGPPTGAVGFAMGMESSMLALEKVYQDKVPLDEGETPTQVYLISIGNDTHKECFKIAKRLRAQGLSCDLDYEGRSPKAQMRTANKLGAKRVIMIGPDELAQGRVKLKDMETGKEKLLTEDQIAVYSQVDAARWD
ncbi:MAG: histidine--tRNA ligase [Planctomycetes bacterium RIFCSPHIGHO2_02_FULL_50_42]|nr:MAG: histidine--tRNA ligase [Planctomycetes bacterium GWA2_50_13]OHB87642.1 MAG: histidine--tRNA ligase [Planctomycetes bacterium RIFCSPHIGHO2_02_FULL_50_42]OHB95406.1 MAG: histidine--tRNA ligase [Planctomycetes bacterium RIFCSPLOWO2_02_FULL_50_16]HCN19793.1 histidine--tRNA ligase [Planctomycetia bacterium]